MNKTRVIHFITAIIRYTRCYYTRKVTIAQLNFLKLRGQIKGLRYKMYIPITFPSPQPNKVVLVAKTT